MENKKTTSPGQTEMNRVEKIQMLKDIASGKLSGEKVVERPGFTLDNLCTGELRRWLKLRQSIGATAANNDGGIAIKKENWKKLGKEDLAFFRLMETKMQAKLLAD